MSFPELKYSVTIRHWLPILTFCPVNKLPDLLYVSITFEDEFVELYAVRKAIRKMLSMKCKFMENIAHDIILEYPSATSVTVALAFGRHVVTMERPFV